MITSCVECPQYAVKEIEPELPAYCLYWGEGLLLNNPICRHHKIGRVPGEPVSAPSDGQEGQSEADLRPGRHLVKISSVRGYMHNFQDYFGRRARLKMSVLESPDAGMTLFDNISLPHPKEPKGMQQRRVLIAHRLGLIPWGSKETIQVNWKLLDGLFVPWMWHTRASEDELF